MNTTKVSVIIPVYGGAKYLGAAIQSVLDQTYPHFELIIVNDASPDHTARVVAQFEDPRILYIEHKENHGVIITRRNGIEASSGDIIAYLDQDDRFHPDKLLAHVEFHNNHPHIGFTYNSHFEVNHASETIREIRRAPRDLSLGDLVLDFPLAPSVWVMKRRWAFYDEIWDKRTYFRGREIVICGRLFLAGCKFARIDRVLNYRRHHRGRVIQNIKEQCRAERKCQEIIFADPRCPPEVLGLQNIAYSNLYNMWAFVAFAQNESTIGQELLMEAVRLNPIWLSGEHPQLIDYLITVSVDDDGLDHADLIKNFFAQLPTGVRHLTNHLEWAIARGYLIKGTRAIMWNRPDRGSEFIGRAVSLGVKIDDSYLEGLIAQILAYEAEYGAKAAQERLDELITQLKRMESQASIRQLISRYSVNQAFENYHRGHFEKVPKNILQAVIYNPDFIINRGVWSALFRSSVNLGKKKYNQQIHKRASKSSSS